MIMRVSMAELTSPPTIGAAILFITWDPVSVPVITGSRPIKVVATVIILGLTRSTAPPTMAADRSAMEAI